MLYSYLVVIDYGFELEELWDIKRSLKEMDKILVQLPHDVAETVLQEAVNRFYENQEHLPRLPEDLIQLYSLENAKPFWAVDE